MEPEMVFWRHIDSKEVFPHKVYALCLKARAVRDQQQAARREREKQEAGRGTTD